MTTPTPDDVLARANDRLAVPGWYVPRISDGELLEDLAAEVARLRAQLAAAERAGNFDVIEHLSDAAQQLSDEYGALAAAVAALRSAVHDLGGSGHRYEGEKARRMANAWAGAYGWPPDTAEAVAHAITTQETS